MSYLKKMQNLTITTGGSSAGNISFGAALKGDDTTDSKFSDVSLTSGSGTVALAAISTDIRDVTVSAGTANVTLSGNITLEGGTSDSGVLDITGNVLAAAPITINTTDAGGGAVTITGKLDSTGAARDIDILSGAGLTSITGNIGTVLKLNFLI